MHEPKPEISSVRADPMKSLEEEISKTVRADRLTNWAAKFSLLPNGRGNRAQPLRSSFKTWGRPQSRKLTSSLLICKPRGII